MKNYNRLRSAGGLWLLLLALNAVAQTNSTGLVPSQGDRVGQAIVTDSTTAKDSLTTVVRPPRPEQLALSPEVKERVERFKRERQAYLDREQALKKELVGANDEERAKIREQLKASLDKWREQSRQQREELRERQRELMEKLPNYREVIDSSRESVRESVREAVQDNRERRGQD